MNSANDLVFLEISWTSIQRLFLPLSTSSGAMGIHAANIVVARMMHGAKPQPPHKFTPAAFLA
jgi:hypothetical protein